MDMGYSRGKKIRRLQMLINRLKETVRAIQEQVMEINASYAEEKLEEGRSSFERSVEKFVRDRDVLDNPEKYCFSSEI